MTVLEILLVFFACLMPRFAPQPKKGPKPKARRKPIPARSGRLKRGSVAFRYRPPTLADIAYAEEKKIQNLAQTAGAQPTLALIETLNALGVRHWREEITWYDGNRFFLSDFWLPDHKITVEQDGIQHRREKLRDDEKARIILETRGFRTYRFWNAWFLTPDLTAKVARLLNQ